MEERSIERGFRQNKAFKQRVTYWRAKGLLPDEAYERASATRPRLAVAPRSTASCRLVSDGLTNKDIMPETLSGTTCHGDGRIVPGPQAMPRPFPSVDETKTVPSQPSVSTNHRPEESCIEADAIYLAVCFAAVVGASVVLVRSSAAVFGGGWEGWLKAFLLELGIVGLSVYRAMTIAELLLARVGSVLLATLSLYVLHTSVRNDAARELTAAESSSAEVAELQQERAELMEGLKALPTSHSSRRQDLLRQLTDNSNHLQSARQNAAQGQGAQAVERRYNVEAFARLALMFLNLAFAHGLKTRLQRRREIFLRRTEVTAT